MQRVEEDTIKRCEWWKNKKKSEEIGEADDGEVCSRSGSRCQKQKSEAEAKKRHRALRKGRRVKKCA